MKLLNRQAHYCTPPSRKAETEVLTKQEMLCRSLNLTLTKYDAGALLGSMHTRDLKNHNLVYLSLKYPHANDNFGIEQ